ncbi:HAD family acid phosphatase [Streptomyces sp. NPDC048696]|uniref:HAD family acid phosphatase n=1 Tax=Streptomyces sp. NPDC048696 TaxID=3365585 RepID=UPI003718A204
MHRTAWTTRAVVTVAAAATALIAAPTASEAAPRTVAVQSAGASAITAPKGVDYTTWLHDVGAVVDVARPYLKQRLAASPAGEKPAIVLDIDNTSLETDFHHFWTFPTPAIQSMHDMVREANAEGAAVFFVTARPGIIESLTSYNLKAVGYPVTGLYVRDLDDLFENVATYKTEKRAEIEARGYTIVANFGNNTTDLVGGHAERSFKLPDYGGKLS